MSTQNYFPSQLGEIPLLKVPWARFTVPTCENKWEQNMFSYSTGMLHAEFGQYWELKEAKKNMVREHSLQV